MTDTVTTSSPALALAAEFRSRHGRALRVLHIGNIANNAFLNAKFLNARGVDCDVICAGYYHIMGCPEWEDADFTGTIDDHFAPDWTRVDLRGYERPRWFVQGPQHTCIEYLMARRSGRTEEAERKWQELGIANKTLPTSAAWFGADGVQGGSPWRHAAAKARQYVELGRERADWRELIVNRLRTWGRSRGAAGAAVATLLIPISVAAVFLLRMVLPHVSLDQVGPWQRRFAEVFPKRPDQLQVDDIVGHLSAVPEWQALFAHYDIVQAYATDVVTPMLAGKHPYIGFEHGTLRTFTLSDNGTSRLTALGYHDADHVFITNGDCLEYAEKIGVSAYTPMVHPVDDRRIASISGVYAERHAELGAKYLFVCPLRHDWVIKGTDVYIRALPQIVERIGRSFRVVMTKWGTQVDDSVRLAESLGVNDLIVWGEPLSRGALIREQKSADIVFDQIALPHFGATAPQAIAAGVPVIMSYDPSSTAWIIPEPAPILPAWNPDDVAAAVQTAIDPEWRAGYERRAREWFERYHSSDRAAELLSEAYRSVSCQAGLL